MNILHINCNYIGTKLHRSMIEHLNDLGIGNTVYVPVCGKPDDGAATKGSRVVVSSCFKKWHRILFDYKQSRIIRDVQKKLDCSQYDCIHAYTLFTDGNCARRLSRRYHIPYVTAVRSTDVNVFLKNVFYLRGRAVKILRDASAVFFLSETYRTQVLERYVPERLRGEIYAKSHIIPNGIDDFWLENRNLGKQPAPDAFREKKLRIVCAGVVNRRKNQLTTQKALQLLRAQGWNIRYQIVGRVEDRELFDQIMAYPDTEYIPQQPKEKLLEYYRQNDLFVMPSRTETFGLVYAEALSQGLPVLYTRGQGFDGQFAEGVAGYAVDADNPGEIAERIMDAAQRLAELSGNGLRLAERFCWKGICERYRDLYEEIQAREDAQST